MKRNLIIAAVGLLLIGPAHASQKTPDRPRDARTRSLLAALDQVIKSSGEDRTVQSGLRSTAQSAKVNAKDAETSAKVEKLKHDVANAQGQLASSWASFSRAFNVAAGGSGTASGLQDPAYSEALNKCKSIVKQLEGLHAKFVVLGGAGKDIQLMARIRDEAEKMRAVLTVQMRGAPEMSLPKANTRVVVKRQSLEPTRAGQDELRKAIGGSTAIFRVEGGHLIVANSANSGIMAMVPITNGTIIRGNLVEALNTVGFSEEDISLNLSGITRSLNDTFGIGVT